MDLNTLKTLNYYNGISQGYSELYHEEQKYKIKLIENYLPIKGNILDLGCGDGIITKFISDTKNVISLDLSFELLKLNPSSNKVNASIDYIPLKDNSIDNIVSFTVIQDVIRLEHAFNQINRVLKSNGTIIISFLKFSKKKEEIIKQINKYFVIQKEIEQEKDLIIIAKKK